QTVIYGQHDVTAACKVLVERVCVCVVVRIVPAKQHLSRWSTMNVDDCRLLCGAAWRFEQLRVNVDTVRRFVDHRFRDHETSRGEVAGDAIFSERDCLAWLVHSSWQGRTLCGCADIRDVLAVAGDERRPLEAFTGSDDLR